MANGLSRSRRRVRGSLLAMGVGLSLALVTSPLEALDVRETPSGGLEIKARGEALATVLELVAKKAGVTIEYDGPPPPDKVFIDLTSTTPTEGILRVLEGQKIAYAAEFDATGQRMERLVLVTKKGSSSSPSRGTSARRGRGPFRPPVPDVIEDPMLDEEPELPEDIEPPEEPESAEEPEAEAPPAAPVDGNSAVRTIPFPSAPPAGPPTDPPVPPPPTGDAEE